jgi:NAD(P)-dependent dehydrogenase (short-subunit alcohol dehydrogenase family)
MINIDLSNKVALITGVSSGIGKGIAHVLAKAGCDIAGCGLEDEAEVKDLKKSVQAFGKSFYYQKADLTKEFNIDSFVKGTIEKYGKIDILISNAGINLFKGALGTSSADWDDNENINLKSHWLISKYCYPYLAEGGGSIVIMTSNHAYSSIPGCFPYNVTKTALTGLVRSLAIEWGSKIRVNGLAPGFIETEGGKAWFNSFDDPAKEKEKTINIHPVKRLGSVEEVGALCAYLVSDFAGFMTGATYLIDGGRSALMQDI